MSDTNYTHKTSKLYIVCYTSKTSKTRKSRRTVNGAIGCQGYILFAVYQEESIFMLLILFDPTSVIIICSTDRTCISFKKFALSVLSCLSILHILVELLLVRIQLCTLLFQD